MPENIENQPWMDSPWVETMTDYDNLVDEVCDLSKIAWFDVKMSLQETDQEKKERLEAIQEQISLGILQPNGFPVGMEVPGGVSAVPQQQRKPAFTGFNFPGAVGVPLPAKFDATPVTRHLQEALNRPAPKGIDQNVFARGEEKMKRINELMKDRRK